jgi:hypothetical protein
LDYPSNAPSFANLQTSQAPISVRPSATSFRKSAYTIRRPIDLGKFVSPAILLMVLGAIAFLGYLALRRYDVTATIAGFDWNRTIHVDEYRTVREGDWSAPAGARNISTQRKIHHYDRVLDHYESKTRQVSAGSESYDCGRTDNGDGTFTDRTCSRTVYRTESYQEPVYRDEPVYRTWYDYDIDKWIPARQVNSANDSRTDPTPFWNELTLKCANAVQLGCERENRREEHYFVTFKWQDGEETRTFRYEDSRGDWDQYDQGQSFTLTFNGFNTLMNDPLRPETE